MNLRKHSDIAISGKISAEENLFDVGRKNLKLGFFQDLERKKYKQAEKRCKEVLDEARTYNENELPNKSGFLATTHGLLGNALMEQGRLEGAETNHQKDLEFSKDA